MEGRVNEYLESNAPTLLGELPDAARWVEAKAGPLIFNIFPQLFRGLALDARTGTIAGYPEVEGKGVYEVSVSNSVGSTTVRLFVTVGKDPLAEAQQTSRLAERVQLMREFDPAEAEREHKREARMRLAKFAGPFPRSYALGKDVGAVKASPQTPRSTDQSPRGPHHSPASPLSSPNCPAVRRDRSDEFMGAVPGHGMLSRYKLQAIFRDYQLY